MSRADKVSRTLFREISNIIHDEIKDPRLGLVTVTGVELTQDLRNAKVYFSVLGSPEKEKETFYVLEHASGFIRSLVAQRVKLRFVPEIMFRIDRSIEYGIEIEEKLQRLKDESKKSHSDNKKRR